MKGFVGLLAALCPTSVALAASVQLGVSADHLEMQSLDAESELSTELIGGTIATADEYPGVFYTSQGSSRCTGTVVGERVVASAAHCMSNGGSLALTYKDVRYTGRCTHAPGYRTNSTADWALCLLSEAIPDPIAETVNTDATPLAVGGQIVLMGYGCIYSGGSGGNDGKLRIGRAPIRSLPSGTSYDIITRGTSALCYGDSGGPSFYVDAETGKRVQTGINSRGDISTTSYLSSLHVRPAQDFYRTFAEQNGVTICGISDDAQGCRE